MAPCEVHHVVEGPEAAPALVFVNSLGTDLGMWEPQASALRDDFRIVRFDARGHGRSPVPAGPYSLADLGGDVLALLDRLEIERASLCGISLGGATAVWVAAHAPGRVESLVAAFTAADFGPPEPWRERAGRVRAEGIEAVADAVLARWFTPALGERDPELVTRMRATLLATPAAGYAACCELVGELDLEADLALIEAPTLVLSGAEDEATPPALGRHLAAGIAVAEFVEIPGAAHIGNLERPALVSDLIGSHLAPVLHRSQTKETAMSGSDYERGMKVRREVLGDEHVDRAEARKDEFTQDFQEFITRYAWGDVWSRPGLDRRSRSVATLAALVSLGAENEIAMHVRAARTNGLLAEEIKEVILHTAVYAGVPKANAAFAIAQQALAEDEPN